jgi:hypothetical protein
VTQTTLELYIIRPEQYQNYTLLYFKFLVNALKNLVLEIELTEDLSCTDAEGLLLLFSLPPALNQTCKM